MEKEIVVDGVASAGFALGHAGYVERTLDKDITDIVDVDALRREVQEKYREVAADPPTGYSIRAANPLLSRQSAWPLAHSVAT
jgi:hypothetical protein